MTSLPEEIRKRRIQVHHLVAGQERIAVTVEMASKIETKVGVSISVVGEGNVDSADLDVRLLGRGHFNPVAFPRSGILPVLTAVGGSCAIATYRFETVDPGDKPTGVEIEFRHRVYRIRLDKRPRVAASPIPPAIAKVLPKTTPKRPAK